ncbi:MAG: serine/threonine protein kinase [Phycisphaerae bacterium]|jgi:hypothetical protein|nr:serine/threonine protein kinase [Phycisphaerae bacterium]
MSDQPTDPPLEDPSRTADSSALPQEPDRSHFPSLDGYEVLEEVGQGSFGVVYRCRSKLDGRLGGRPGAKFVPIVAIKVPKDSLAAVALFKSEMELLLRLPDHDHVVRVIGEARADFDDGRSLPALVMAWIPNARTIDAHCDHRRLGRPARLALLAHVADGLAHLHEHGVLHLDLKPSNILVGDDGRPVIVDLGGSRCRMGIGHPPSVLTIAYASPEQLDGIEPETLDQRSDVYSFGRLMGSLLLGADANALPRSRSRAELIDRMRAWQPEEYRRHARWPEGDLGDLILSTLVRDRSKRDIVIHELRRRLLEIARPGMQRVGAWLGALLRSRVLHVAAILVMAIGLGILIAVIGTRQYIAAGVGPPIRFPARAPEALDQVVIVHIENEEEIRRAIAPFADQIVPMVPRNRRRHLFAEIVRAAARGQASVTVIDAMIPLKDDAPSGTKALAEAVREVGSLMPVVTGLDECWVTRTDPKSLDPSLSGAVRDVGSFDVLPSGRVDARFTDLLFIPIAVEREGHVTAWSLSAAAVAAHYRGDASIRHPSNPFALRTVEFRSPWEERREPRSRQCELELAYRIGEGPPLSSGTRLGDEVSVLAIRSAAIRELCKPKAIGVREFLELDPAGLQSLVRNRIVVVWNGEDKDVHAVDDQGTVAGGWIQAVAIQSLLTLPNHTPSAERLVLLMVLAAAAGATIGLRFGGSIFRRPRLAGGLLLSGVTIGLSVVLLLLRDSRDGGWDFATVVILLSFAFSQLTASTLQCLRLMVQCGRSSQGTIGAS